MEHEQHPYIWSVDEQDLYLFLFDEQAAVQGVDLGGDLRREHSKGNDKYEDETLKTSQELRMLSSVTLNCQVTKIVMNSGSQLSEF